MLKPGDIIHGFAKNLYTPKYKYAVCLYRDDNLEVLLHFTTSQPRAGVSEDKISHGAIYNQEGDCLSYVFEAGKEIGVDPKSRVRFSFPKRTVMVFHYGLLKVNESSIREQFDDLEVVCKLDPDEYINLVYAMYKSKSTPKEHIPFLQKILDDYYK